MFLFTDSLRLTHCFVIGLKVKVDAKTKTLLEDYKKKKKAKGPNHKESRNGDKSEGEEGEDEKEENDEDLDEFTMREDRVAKAGLDAIMREYTKELSKEPSHGKFFGCQKRLFISGQIYELSLPVAFHSERQSLRRQRTIKVIWSSLIFVYKDYFRRF